MRAMHADDPIEPLYDALRDRVPALRIVDVHTHIRANDPDGIAISAAELGGALAEAERCLDRGARGAGS